MKKFISMNIKQVENGYFLQITGMENGMPTIKEYLCETLEDVESKFIEEGSAFRSYFDQIFRPETTNE